MTVEPAASDMLSVLVVDDDLSVRRLLRVVLPLAGPFRIVGEAGDGDSAIDLAVAEKPDIVVLDYMMPIKTGARTAERLREVSPSSDIVFFSAYVDAMNEGHDMFITSLSLGCEIVPKGDTTRLEEVMARVAARRKGVSAA